MRYKCRGSMKFEYFCFEIGHAVRKQPGDGDNPRVAEKVVLLSDCLRIFGGGVVSNFVETELVVIISTGQE